MYKARRPGPHLGHALPPPAARHCLRAATACAGKAGPGRMGAASQRPTRLRPRPCSRPARRRGGAERCHRCAAIIPGCAHAVLCNAPEALQAERIPSFPFFPHRIHVAVHGPRPGLLLVPLPSKQPWALTACTQAAAGMAVQALADLRCKGLPGGGGWAGVKGLVRGQRRWEGQAGVRD